MSKYIKKTIINSSALYGKIILNTATALIGTRIALKYLGEVNFGLFSLIGGVVMMLSFLNGSLMQSTQRFLSISIGKGDNNDETKQIFNAGIMLHIFMSGFLLILFLGSQPLLFNGFLNIPIDRIGVSIKTYQIVAVTTIITFITIPYNAAINAREDMWFFAIADAVMSLMKLCAAVVLIFLPDNNGSLLVIYSVLILFSTIVSSVMKVSWCRNRYKECLISKKYLWNIQLIKPQLGFTGWNSITSLATIIRNQGVAVVINLFFGPIINAAYGVANQVNALVAMVASTLSTVFAPQIIQSYGANDNARMMRIAVFSSKISLMLSLVMSLPILTESQFILRLWLGNTPAYSSEFCKLIVLIFLVMQIYPGLVRALYAQGDIKWYQIIISIALISPVSVGYVMYTMYAFKPQLILYLMLLGQITTLCITLYFAKKKVGLDVRHYIVNSVIKPILIFGLHFFSAFSLTSLIDSEILRLIICCLISALVLPFILYKFFFDHNERKQISKYFGYIKNKII